MLSPPRGRLLAVAIGVPVLVGAWLLLWGTTYADPFVRFGWRCLALTAATAPWPFLALHQLSRRLEPPHPQLAGAHERAVGDHRLDPVGVQDRRRADADRRHPAADPVDVDQVAERASRMVRERQVVAIVGVHPAQRLRPRRD